MNNRQIMAAKLVVGHPVSPGFDNFHDQILDAILSENHDERVRLILGIRASETHAEQYWADVVAALFIARQEEAGYMLDQLLAQIRTVLTCEMHAFIPVGIIGLLAAHKQCRTPGFYLSPHFDRDLSGAIGQLLAAYLAGAQSGNSQCSDFVSGALSNVFAEYLSGAESARRARALLQNAGSFVEIKANTGRVLDALNHRLFATLGREQQFCVLRAAFA